MLARVVARARRAQLIDSLLVATTETVDDDAVVNECTGLGVAFFRGSKEDVLDRYYRAAGAEGAAIVVRLTADCPLIDAEVVDQVIRTFRQEGPDYASNTLERTFPRGLDCEVFGFEALRQAWEEAREPHHRAHVTPFIYENPDRFRLVSITAGVNLACYRWTVDTSEDLRLVREIFARLRDPDGSGWQQALDVLRLEPALADINRHVTQKSLDGG